jgi:hypothetical protein
MFYKVISENDDGHRYEEIDVSPHNLVLMYNDSKKESGYSSNELSDESANESSDESATLELYDTSSNDSCSESEYESNYNMIQSDGACGARRGAAIQSPLCPSFQCLAWHSLQQ